MLTYSFDKAGKTPLYEYLYLCIKKDILSGVLTSGSRLPSKRAFAKNLGVSTITVENAYAQLIAEGYLYAIEKKGYFVSDVASSMALSSANSAPVSSGQTRSEQLFSQPERKKYFIDFSSNATSPNNFPFTIWARLMRGVISEKKENILTPPPPGGTLELRQSIADYLYEFRGMTVSARQIIIGAGTEYLYGLLIQLLGRDKIYAVEDPGYTKIQEIYAANQVSMAHIPLDSKGVIPDALRESSADVLHLSPSHHFPTGIITPIKRRQELLQWAGEKDGRFILEDDYDSEFRLLGKPIPTLQSIDENGRVIYINTFSKSLASTIRISYMILPEALLAQYEQNLSFYSCTVSTFEQYTLSHFLDGGYFEKHINRMRNFYRKQRNMVLNCIKKSPLSSHVTITEEDAGLHFLMTVHTKLSDKELIARAKAKDIRISCLSDYCYDKSSLGEPVIIINYSGLKASHMDEAFRRLYECLS